jgi:hypothetical protein
MVAAIDDLGFLEHHGLGGSTGNDKLEYPEQQQQQRENNNNNKE